MRHSQILTKIKAMGFIPIAAALMFTILVFTPVSSFAQSADEIPGLVPLYPGQAPAVDLVDEQGHDVLPEELHQRYLQSKGAYDLSLLNPKTDSDIWKDEYPQQLDPALDDLGIKNGDEVQYVAPVTGQALTFRFGAQLITPSGSKKLLSFEFNRMSTDVLLRKALLRKIGYHLPPVKRMAKLNLKFRDSLAQEGFFNLAKDLTLFDANGRWVESVGPADSNTVVLQDVLALTDQPQSYALYDGVVPKGLVKERRLMRALIIPYELVNIPETVNQFPWEFGQVSSNHLRMSYHEASEFDGNYDDARWIGRRILKLTRADWEQIVAQTETPAPVQKVILEKLIARRNDMAKVLNLEATPIAFNPDVSEDPYLKEGKLSFDKDDKGQDKVWPGYGQRFSFGDPEAPFSTSDILHFTASKTLANLISNLVTQFNDKIMPHTDLAQKIQDRAQEQAQKRFMDFIKTGKVGAVNFGAWAIPTYGTDLIASRDIVIGSYLGTDNMVQLADSVGVSANIEAFIGFDHIPSPWAVSGKVGGAITRTYTHLRPLKSVKAAIKYPFKNILVPLLKHEYGDLLDDISQEKIDKIADDAEKKKELARLIGVFKDQMQKGESIIITDTIGGQLDLQAGYQFTDVVKAYAGFSAQQTIISRLHIHRFDDNTLHIYRDLGTNGSIELSLSLKAEIPIITVSAKGGGGIAKTKFFSVNISPVIDDNPDFYRNVQALKQVFNNNSLSALENIQKPYVLSYSFDQDIDRVNFLFYRWAWLKSGTKIEIEKPDVAKHRNFYRQVTSSMQGKNFEELTLDVINYGISQATKEDVTIANTATGRPSNSIFGSSVVRSVTVDGETTDALTTNKGKVDDFFVQLTYDWAGWEISKSDAQKIIDDINKRNGLSLFPDNVLNNTNKIQFYDIQLYYNIYADGIKHMLGLNRDQLRAIFETYKVRDLTRITADHHSQRVTTPRVSVVDDYLKARQYFANRYETGDIDLYYKHLNTMISFLETYLSKQGILEIFGGEHNVLIGARISGFRYGDEDGDQPYIAHTSGEYGSAQTNGPLENIRNQINMTESEFYLYWILERL